MPTNTYILRARVIEGCIPMPKDNDPLYKDLTEDNFEIIALYTEENLNRLFDIGKEAFNNGTLSKFEILAWAGGANNHDGDRYIWSFRPDKYNFECIEPGILSRFDTAEPIAFDNIGRQYYDKFWRPLKFGFSLKAYESAALGKESKSLLSKINHAMTKSGLLHIPATDHVASPER